MFLTPCDRVVEMELKFEYTYQIHRRLQVLGFYTVPSLDNTSRALPRLPTGTSAAFRR